MTIVAQSRRSGGPMVCRGRAPLVVTAAVLAVAGAVGSAARADEPDAAARAYAQKIAITVCGTCHGADGNSTNPKFPRLAGQNANYLVTQLKAFRSQTRGDPDAIGYMWGMASELDDAGIEALTQYYHAQQAEPSASGQSPEIERGRQIFEHGIESQGVPACATCHGPDAHGLQDFPRLAGQHAQYVLKQLASFQSNMRNVAVMHGVAQNLRLQEMEAVAAYLEVQR
ncbi:MAG TPA: c-type cytochrome [Steroidobacteraceae bacterium]|nr:c-type cytochrome [Steroidobacteraceae bacterium]